MARKHEATHLVVVIKYILDLYKCTVLKAIVYKGVIFYQKVSWSELWAITFWVNLDVKDISNVVVFLVYPFWKVCI